MVAIVINTDILAILVMIVFITTFSLASSAFGSIVNLTWPKFDFVDPVEVVKQSVGAILGLIDSIGWEISILLGAVLNILFFGLAAYYINQKAESLFIKFNG